MSQTASGRDFIAVEGRLLFALELGWKKWRLAFASAMGQKPWQTVIAARDLPALSLAIQMAKQRFGLSQECLVCSCYEAGRDGFWIDRLLKEMGIKNLVVDSSSIEVKRRARRVKTDRIDAAKLLSMLFRHFCGEPGVWSVVRVPAPEQENARQLTRQIRTAKKDRARSINRIRALLATQGVTVKMGCRGLLESLESLRIWDGSPLPAGLRRRLECEIARHAFLHRQLLDLESERDARIRNGSDLASQVARHLMTLKSVGQVSASTLSDELSWRELKNRRQVGGLIGLAPSPYQSGESSREAGISRAGNRHVRGIAIDLAWAWVRHQPKSHLTLWFEKRFGRGSPRLRKIGIVALARKLIIALWRYADFGQIPKGALLKPQL